MSYIIASYADIWQSHSHCGPHSWEQRATFPPCCRPWTYVGGQHLNVYPLGFFSPSRTKKPNETKNKGEQLLGLDCSHLWTMVFKRATQEGNSMGTSFNTPSNKQSMPMVAATSLSLTLDGRTHLSKAMLVFHLRSYSFINPVNRIDIKKTQRKDLCPCS